MAEKVLGCCGIEGKQAFGFKRNSFGENSHYTANDKKLWQKSFIDAWPGVIPAAAVQINLTSKQEHACSWMREAGFQELSLGRNPNTGANIFAYFMPAKALQILIKEWMEELKPKRKKNNPFLNEGEAA